MSIMIRRQSYQTVYLLAAMYSLTINSSYGAFTSLSPWSMPPTIKFSSSSTSPRTFMSSSSSSDNRDLSAASRERREEDKRRKERRTENVPGKTSAKAGEKDYAIDPSATEQEYLRQLSYIEQEIYRQTENGMKMLKMFRLDEATEAFDKVFSLKPNAYVWHAGIARFYQNEFEDAASIFARTAGHYESKFGGPASEERIWRDACELKYISSMPKRKGKELLQQLQEQKSQQGDDATLLAGVPCIADEDGEDPFGTMIETRKVLRIARDLFEASLNNDYSTVVLSRAKLRAICGVVDGSRRPRPDIKMWKLSSWFFLGLHYDALGEVDESKDCMKMALLLCPSIGNADNIIHTLPALHMTTRDWYDDDDDEFMDDDEDDLEVENGNKAAAASDFLSGGFHFLDNRKEKSSTSETTKPTSQQQPKQPSSSSTADPVMVDSVRGSIAKLNLQQLKEALRTRGLKVYGSKEELGEKLFRSLMEDVGLDV